MRSISNKVLSATRRYQWLIVTLLLLGGISLYYFVVVLTQNEMRIKERSFRGLSLMSRNIEHEINNTLTKNAQNFLRDLDKYKNKNKEDSATREEIKKNYNLHKFSIESRFIKLPHRFDTGKIFVNAVGSECRLNFELISGKIKDTVYVDASSFIDPLLRKDIFSRYLLINDKLVIYQNLEGGLDASLKDSLKNIEILKSGQMLKHIHYTNGIDNCGKGWRESGKAYMNYVMKNGRRYGIVNSNLCYTVKNGSGEYVNSIPNN